MGCPFLLQVTRGVGLPWTSQGRITSDPTSAAILTIACDPSAPTILGLPIKMRDSILQFKFFFWVNHQKRLIFMRFPTVNTQMHLSAGVAHCTGGGANIDPCILRRGTGDVQTPISCLKRCWYRPVWGISTLRREGDGRQPEHLETSMLVWREDWNAHPVQNLWSGFSGYQESGIPHAYPPSPFCSETRWL